MVREIKVKAANGNVYKIKGRLASGVYDTETNKEVYEGDILEITEINIPIGNEVRNKSVTGYKSITYITDVKYEDGALVVKSGEDDYDNYLANFHGDPSKTYPFYVLKIIGNVYENPEILNVKEDD